MVFALAERSFDSRLMVPPISNDSPWKSFTVKLRAPLRRLDDDQKKLTDKSLTLTPSDITKINLFVSTAWKFESGTCTVDWLIGIRLWVTNRTRRWEPARVPKYYISYECQSSVLLFEILRDYLSVSKFICTNRYYILNLCSEHPSTPHPIRFPQVRRTMPSRVRWRWRRRKWWKRAQIFLNSAMVVAKDNHQQNNYITIK